MKTKKSKIVIFIVAALLVLVLSVAVFAEPSSDGVYEAELDIMIYGGLPLPEKSYDGKGYIDRYLSSAYLPPIEEYLYGEIMAQNSNIDISAYGMTVDEMIAAIQRVLNSYGELFFVGREYHYSVSGDIAGSVALQYIYTGEAYKAAKAEYDYLMAELIARIPEGLSPLATALAANDIICTEFEYSPKDSYVYNVYDMMRGGHGVCQAYTMLYSSMMRHFGIECEYVTSEMKNHIWNKVKINGEFFNVDVTWNDPIGNGYGYARHEYFLLSDKTMMMLNGATDAVSSVEAKCRDYDDAFWSTVISPFVYVRGVAYYIDREGGYLSSFDFENYYSNELVYIGKRWRTDAENTYYPDCFATVAAAGNYLYYNTDSGIYVYEPMFGNSKSLITTDRDGGYFYSFSIDKDSLKYARQYSPDPPIYGGAFDIKNYGELNGDGKISNIDAILLMRQLAGIDVNAADTELFDCDLSGALTNEDAVYLLRVLAGW